MPINEIDPTKIVPLEGRCLIKRAPAADKRGSIYIPQQARENASFEGVIININERPHGDAVGVRIGDHVLFSQAIGSDDSTFFRFMGEDYVLIPTDAILGVAA
ncbi:MAG: co-chaperone GroES family protein [Bacteroidota bacterium]